MLELDAMAKTDPARVRLGRIRCLVNAIECMKRGQPLPEALCFVPKETLFELEGEEALIVYEEPKTDAKIEEKVHPGRPVKLTCSGQPQFNSTGGWMRLVSPHSGWVLLQPAKRPFKGKLRRAKKEGDVRDDWLSVIENTCSLQIVKQSLSGTQPTHSPSQRPGRLCTLSQDVERRTVHVAYILLSPSPPPSSPWRRRVMSEAANATSWLELGSRR